MRFERIWIEAVVAYHVCCELLYQPFHWAGSCSLRQIAGWLVSGSTETPLGRGLEVLETTRDRALKSVSCFEGRSEKNASSCCA